ncbi:MAG: hypothetical protein QGG39_06875, partial [Candidatus Poribacteria bacterium]|nr:hypothetical protein [Candidatus Poribacteria bacterium]
MCRRWAMITLVVLLALNVGHTEINPESIVGIWLMDEGQGKSVTDSSRNGNNGKIVGAKWTNGKLGKGLSFDGKSRVEIPASKTTDDYQNGFTYLLWIKPTEPPPNV